MLVAAERLPISRDRMVDCKVELSWFINHVGVVLLVLAEGINLNELSLLILNCYEFVLH